MADDDVNLRPLRGAWILVAGPDGSTAARLRARLGECGVAAVELASDAEEAWVRTEGIKPDGVIALLGMGDEMRSRLDPMGVGVPAIVAVDELTGLPAGEAGDAVVLDRLASRVERTRLVARVRDLESRLATSVLEDFRAAANARDDALERLATAAEFRDDNTWEHTQRVGAMAAGLGRRLGLGDAEVQLIRVAAPLHDVGKIAIPDSILLKPGQLNDEEYEVVKTHAALGARILEGSDVALYQRAAEICSTHHERWDGKGYPLGLTGDEIPLAGRLVAVADVFDILVHERPYKESMSVDDAAEELRRNAGSQFDPEVIAAFDDFGAASWHALVSEAF